MKKIPLFMEAGTQFRLYSIATIATTLFVALSLVSYQHPCGLVGLEGERREKGRGTPPTP
jgi:hypothetical protein